MCHVLNQVARQPAPSGRPGRRRILKTLGAATAAGALLPLSSTGTASAAPRRHRTRLVLLGTAGGPAWLDGGRCGVSSAVVYEDRVYLVDLGHGAMHRLVQSGLGAGDGLGSALSPVRGIFLTHLHSDHVADWPALFATGPTNVVGRGDDAIQVFGPGDRGVLPAMFPPGAPAPAVFNPERPTPGISAMTAYLGQAFATDFNGRSRESGFTRPDDLFSVHDVDLGGVWTVDPAGKPPRLKAPLPLWEDGDVRVTATLVDHAPTAPAFAFRFDTPDGSIVFSGDTCVSANLIDLARDADVLVHEVIDPRFVDQLVAALPASQRDAMREHLLTSHTTIDQVGRDVAEPAGARQLVLNHLVPATNPARRWRAAQRGYSGRLVVGEDLLTVGVGRARS
ncbi:MBL fold metallo-hydrolase [Streptomyces hyderabadensis]|uniref:MBL fold metallo-hydrolase n=1 Tax=Streptomyces hyderabadensis TaxID=598549 RepID=A0ABP9IH79_9ACTN|nr:MBL fold metallo-hydrolase [Streptomyces hyderabadensis]